MKASLQILTSFLFFSINLLAITLIEETAIITHIADGDTIDVRYTSSSKEKRIRFLGIQAMEIHPTAPGTPNDCYADEATQRLNKLTGGIGSLVILRALDDSIEIQNRLARHIFINKNGKEINIGEKLLEEGLVLPFLHESENTYNNTYMLAAKMAKKFNLGMWSSTNHCSTPADSSNSSFEIYLNYDAEGDDNTNLNGEWIKIKNISDRTVDISNWWLRDSGQNFFRFSNSTILSNNEELIIYGGKGTDNKSSLYWNNTISLFGNTGDGIYLMDYLSDSANPNDNIYPKGNIKASFFYPCVCNCSDDLQGKINISANYDAQGDDNLNPNGEWVSITNISEEIINLQNYLVHSSPQGSDSYVFTDNTPIDSGETLNLFIGSGSDTSLKKYWGKSTGILSNGTDSVWLDTFDGRIIDIFSWPEETKIINIFSTEETILSNVTKLYVATFNRAPDASGLDYWINSSGLEIEMIAKSFFDQSETQTTYPPSSNNTDFVKSVYNNLFNRTPEVEGLNYWVSELDSGRIERSVFILAIINGAQDTEEFGNDATILTNKTAVGLAFSNAGLNNTDNAKNIMLGITDAENSVCTSLETYGIDWN